MKLSYIIALFLPFAFALGAEAPKDTDAKVAELKAAAESIKPQAGEINLKQGLAKLTLPANLRYLSPDDSATVLSKIWGNPVEEKPLGMIVPTGFSPFDPESWAVVINYSDEGHVKDNDAATINYEKLLAEMKKSAKENNEARTKAGYASVDLVGWAASPHYDAVTHKLYWAKELKFSDSEEHTLNYNIRILGRTGVLELNTVARLADLKTVESVTPMILSAVDFQSGNRYADFKEDTDKVATYGIAALVAGGIAAKTGLLKVLWLGILAFKKVIVFGAIAVGGFVKKLFGKKPSNGLHQDPSS